MLNFGILKRGKEEGLIVFTVAVLALPILAEEPSVDREMNKIRSRVQQLEEKAAAPRVSLNGIMAGNVCLRCR